MFEIIQSATFARWLGDLKDQKARMRIHARLDRLALGNYGDVQPIGEGLSELRIHYGPGYRLYCMQRGMRIVVMLCGGDKNPHRNAILNRRKSLPKTGEIKTWLRNSPGMIPPNI